MSSELDQVLTELADHVSWTGGRLRNVALPDETASPDLRALLQVHNGLVAFSGGLRCFGFDGSRLPTLEEWNRPEGWRVGYRSLADGLFFFSEDAFGNQFAFEGTQRVVRFLAETGERELIAESITEWLNILLAQPDEELSLWLVQDWNSVNTPIGPDQHLCPTVPFVVGGKFSREDLHAIDRNESMRFKADFAWQIRDRPDGTKLRFKITD